MNFESRARDAVVEGIQTLSSRVAKRHNPIVYQLELFHSPSLHINLRPETQTPPQPSHPPQPTKQAQASTLFQGVSGGQTGSVLSGVGGRRGLGTISVRTTPQPSVPIPRTRTLARLITSRSNPVATRHLIRLLFKSLASAILLFGSIMVDKLCRLATLLPEKSFSQRACNLTPPTPPTEVAGVGGGGLRRRIWEGELRR